jgi:hypothetical protein
MAAIAEALYLILSIDIRDAVIHAQWGDRFEMKAFEGGSAVSQKMTLVELVIYLPDKKEKIIS